MKRLVVHIHSFSKTLGALLCILALFCQNGKAQTTLGTITSGTSPGCKMSFTVCADDTIRLRPTDLVNYTNFKWYATSVLPANEIDAAAVTAGNFNVVTSSSLPTISIRTPGTTQTLTFIVTAEYSAYSGCAAKNDTIELNVVAAPTAAIAAVDASCTPNDSKVISGDASTLTATGGASYLWSTTATTAGITVNPTATTTYTVTVTNADGCTATASSTVTVVAAPTAAIAAVDASCTPNDGKVISGGASTLTATGGASYLWSTTATTAGITVNPTATTTYTVTVTNADGCTATASSTVTVVAAPDFTLAQATVCPGSADYAIISNLTNAIAAISQVKVNTGAFFAFPAPANITSTEGLVSGGNTIVVRNTDGCETSKMVTVVLTPAASCIPLIIEKISN